jgi:excinuclease UvrABC nuclease subunit
MTKTFEKAQSNRNKQRRKKLESEFRGSKKDARMRKLIERNENRYNIHGIEKLFFKPCIYFLKMNQQTVYIGETTSLMQRITSHINENTKIFDSLSFEVFDGSEAERKAYEAELINRIKPFYNKAHVKEKSVKIVLTNIK